MKKKRERRDFLMHAPPLTEEAEAKKNFERQNIVRCFRMKTAKKKPAVIQSLLFHKALYTKQEARHWLTRHHFKAISKMASQLHYFRATITKKHPSKRFFSKKTGKGITFVFQR